MKLTINELLEARGIKASDKVKFVRHKDNREALNIDGVKYENTSLYDLYKHESTRDIFLRYQNEQSEDRFKGVNYIVSFIGEEGQRSRFIGVFKVLGVEQSKNYDSRFIYTMEEAIGFEELKERIIIDWGQSTISWHQWMDNTKPKSIIEISTPLNYVQFTNYYEFILDRSQLELIFRENLHDWKKALTAVNCVYLITDTLTGQQYVGSTYGKSGVWGRWQGYYNSVHNGNVQLKALVDSVSNYKINFQYTILQTLPINITLNEAIKVENLYKKKLGSRVFGLNSN